MTPEGLVVIDTNGCFGALNDGMFAPGISPNAGPGKGTGLRVSLPAWGYPIWPQGGVPPIRT